VNPALADLIAQADALADLCERTVPHTPGHRAEIDALHAAATPADRDAAVAAARGRGMSWPAIAVVLDLPTDECRRRHDPAGHRPGEGSAGVPGQLEWDPLDALVPDDAA
jgi:hypothetical protein